MIQTTDVTPSDPRPLNQVRKILKKKQLKIQAMQTKHVDEGKFAKLEELCV